MGQPNSRSLDELRDALEHCYAATEALCADLSDDEWRAQSLCPDLDQPRQGRELAPRVVIA